MNKAATVETAVPSGYMGSHRTQQALYTSGSQPVGCHPFQRSHVPYLYYQDYSYKVAAE